MRPYETSSARQVVPPNRYHSAIAERDKGGRQLYQAYAATTGDSDKQASIAQSRLH